MFLSLGSKPKKRPKRERTEEEKNFRRRKRYFLVTQVVAVLVFLYVMSSNDFSEVEVDDDEDEDEGFSYDWTSIHFLTNLYFPWQFFSSWQLSHGHHCEKDSFLFTLKDLFTVSGDIEFVFWLVHLLNSYKKLRWLRSICFFIANGSIDNIGTNYDMTQRCYNKIDEKSYVSFRVWYF